MNNLLKPSDGLINDFTNGCTEQADNTFTNKKIFNKTLLKQKNKEFKAIPTKEFINESFFLYDKSNVIKRKFITALNKELSLYGSITYFSGKKAAKKIRLLDTSNHLKFLIDKRTVQQDLKLHLAYVNSTEVKTTDQKIYNFSIVWLGKRQRNLLITPIDTVIIRAQQDFDVAG